MFEINWESPDKTGNPMFMSQAWAFKAQMLIMEANMKKYFPITYHMMKAFQPQQPARKY